MRISLHAIEAGYEQPREYKTAPIRVGRDPDNHLVLADSSGVSRHHAELRFVDNAWQVVDLNSTNGTYVNGRRVRVSSLQNADELRFGPRGPCVRVCLPTGPPPVATPRRSSP